MERQRDSSRQAVTKELALIKAQLAAATPGPWEVAQGATSDGLEIAATTKQKAAFLALQLNDEDSPIWLVNNHKSIPAVTGDGPQAKADAEFIAAAPTNIARLIALIAQAWNDGHKAGFWNGRESAGSGEMEACGFEHARLNNPYTQKAG